ncbi:glycoside hydrolase family 19 protein [Oligella sp. HMSC09E12]|uniref:glycoside hydrolase family 19 protein n=1 Tax=Oligella sp. HMSC09E12 TaxID=1581147 RepID=UPI0008A2988B|nr:glycoside hydrolase family 19 protein [Oligella sp. HMSC09E12]OFV47558.1 hypothetical protein HMPREF3179_08105 [Oligella sp. HMSC09E12]
MTLEQFRDAAGISQPMAERWYKPFTEAYSMYFVYDPLVMSHVIAQIGHESGGFARLEENLNYRSADRLITVFGSRNGLDRHKAYLLAGNPIEIANFVYGGEWGRRNLGNTQPNDGWFFRGGGLIQLTGRANYTKASKALGIDIVDLPDLVRKDKGIAAQAAMWWLWDNGLQAYFDADDVRGATRRINGGLNGLTDRINRLERAKKVLL